MGKPVYKGTNSSNLDFAPRAHKRWWPSVRTDPTYDNNAEFLWLGDNPEDGRTHGTKTVISAARVELQDLEAPIARDAIRVERKIVWTWRAWDLKQSITVAHHFSWGIHISLPGVF